MRVRKQDAQGDMIFGGSQRAFWINNADAVGQIVSTRLMLNSGEWFLDTTDGTAWDAKVLGNRTASTRDPIIQARVLGTPNVASISNYSSQVSGNTRTFNAAMSVTTTFGPVTIKAVTPTTGTISPQQQYITINQETPYTILVSWSTEPVFTLNSTNRGLLDEGNVLG
jgi:hypothetical protein